MTTALHSTLRVTPLLCAALLLGACNRPAKQTTTGTSATASTTPASSSVNNDLDTAPPKAAALKVSVIVPKTGNLTVTRTASATLKASRDSNVAAQASGAVAQVLAQEGERVAAGQVVVQLDDTSLRQSLQSAQLQLKNAQINLAQTQRNTSQGSGQLQSAVTAAQANYDKAVQDVTANRNLYNLGGVSAADLKSSEAALAQTQSALAQAKNSLAQNGQSGSGSLELLQNQVQSAQVAVQQAQENIAKASVRAPFSGTLATISAKVGEYVSTGAAVFRLVDSGNLSADFSVAPSDAAALSAGKQLNFGYGGKNYVATIKEGDRVAGTDRLVPLSARLAGASNLPVGGVGQMRYSATLGSGTLLPTGAITNDGGANSVYVAKNGVASQTNVSVVAESQGQVAVSGLSGAEQVIYPLPPSLQDGASIQVAK